RKHMQVRWDEIRFLIPTSIVGILIGSFMLISLPREPLLVSLGLFVIFFGLRYVFNVHAENPISRWWSLPTGLIGGLIGALFGTGGPPYVVYLSHRLHDKTQLRGTLSGLFLLDGAFRVITFLSLGLLLQADMFNALLMGLPVMAIGLYLGNKVHLGITQRQQLAIIGCLLLVSGGSLLWKAFSS
ncbi:sulfite exporter TauE/SafE family protein, partial [bacterium]|nr:sulfite exporter TauE/SafE family protein [bacterium]